MYRRLRKNFILVTTLSLLLVLGLTMFILNIVTMNRTRELADLKISAIYKAYSKKNDFDIKDLESILQKLDEAEITKDTPYKIRYFYVVFDKNKILTEINVDRIAEENEAKAKELSEKIINENKSKGYIEKYRYNVESTENGEMVIFLDTVSDLQAQKVILESSLIIGATISGLVILIVSMLSKKVIQPFIDNEEKQRHFITDAGHELKTPISIISANTEMVEILNGESEWTESTKVQLVRMEKLIKNFLALSKSDETSIETQEEINFSELLKNVCKDFKGRAEIKGKTIKAEIQGDIKIMADYEQIQQVINILIDNAIKYAQDDNAIFVNLNKIRKTASLKIGNKIENFTKEDEKKIFNRFYRTDDSRSRDTGGFGLGLSIAAKIIGAHGGKITTTYKNSWLFFNLEFPIL
ncbi:sensor histidine kinase [Miniphocaeibacter massiliensis]|uniref:sensor histidine kinase n=1 Tax=Miniphocaeibacter massiliensis TaxID=2041841 RepID=UPI000C1C22F9|nr:HAMP domain-containing sensor histidine kinase [Miniphocaeibacter massiliensis]